MAAICWNRVRICLRAQETTSVRPLGERAWSFACLKQGHQTEQMLRWWRHAWLRSRRDILAAPSASLPEHRSCDCGRTEEMVALRRVILTDAVRATVPGLRGGTCVLCNRNTSWKTHAHAIHTVSRFDIKVSAAGHTGWSAPSAPCTTNMHCTALRLSDVDGGGGGHGSLARSLRRRVDYWQWEVVDVT
jgi:hypothetical protein